MKRREFSLLTAAATAAAAVLPPHALAQVRQFTEGTDYYVLGKPVSGEAMPNQVEIIEFFWYNCPHCNHFEPTLEPWVKKLPADVKFRRVPIAFQPSFLPQQRLYYALEAMGKVNEMQLKVFHAIHDEHLKLDTPETITTWIAKQGLDTAKFEKEFNSFTTNSKAKQATLLQEAFKIEGVPSFGVAGKYYTDGTLAKSVERALQVVEFLVAKTRPTLVQASPAAKPSTKATPAKPKS